METNRKIYRNKASIYATPRSIWQNEFIQDMLAIVAENETYIVLDDPYFTKIHKEKCSWDSCLNVPHVAIREIGHILEAGVFYIQYSEKPVSRGVIKNRILKEVEQRYGYLTTIDLTILDKPPVNTPANPGRVEKGE